jgi:hypothetical protein
MTTDTRQLLTELDRLLRLLAAQRAIEGQIKRPAPILKRGETGEAQAILAAQLRLKRRQRTERPQV